MKNRNNRYSSNFPQQTHFIGVLLPEDISLTLEDCRRYMREAYGCKSGHATPIHVTLIPPFRLSDEYSTADLARAIEKEVLPKSLGFTAHIDNFDSRFSDKRVCQAQRAKRALTNSYAFGDRTLFAKVVTDEKWIALRDAVYGAVVEAAPGCTKKAGRPFEPHLTVANRDIPAGVMTDALQVMNELNLVEDFPVDNVTIFERQNGKWVSAVSLELNC